jgi:hypothetical protein
LVLAEVLPKTQAKTAHLQLFQLAIAQTGLLLAEMVERTQAAAVAAVEDTSHLADLVGQV